MIRAFIIKVDIEMGELLADVAVDIEDALNKSGLPVESVVPWKGHGIMAEPIKPVGPMVPPPLQ